MGHEGTVMMEEECWNNMNGMDRREEEQCGTRKEGHEEECDVVLLDTKLAYETSRTHHLLKHCLSDGQRMEALEHFGTDDVKDAARDISKMGQRELQNKFKLVYGNTTHSNNNDWLRRKLYEAIGAAPVKMPNKSKVKKTAVTKRKQQQRRHQEVGDIGRRHQKYRRRAGGSLPSSPVVGRSVLDMHRFAAHDMNTSASDDDVDGLLQKARSVDSSEFGSMPSADTVGIFDAYSCFKGMNTLPVLLSDDTAELELLNALPKKEDMGSLRFPEQQMEAEDDDDDIMLLSVDISAFDAEDELMC